MAKQFETIKTQAPRTNKFDLSHERKTTMDFGYLYPIMVQEVLPGDSWRVNTSTMMRFAPMVAPVMHRVNCWTHSFFVPWRLVWDEFEDWITGGRLGDATPVVPFLTMTTAHAAAGRLKIGSLWDHMGLPTAETTDVIDSKVQNIDARFFRAYQLIWNEYYRDQNLSVPVPFTKGSGDMNSEASLLMGMRLRCYEKDYLTSCLPFAQRGVAAEVPIDGVATANDGPEMKTGAVRKSVDDTLASNADLTTVGGVLTGDPTGEDLYQGLVGELPLEADITVEDLRRTVRLQEWLELSARAGGRYVELLKAFFGVTPDDARMQRPEFLGGSKMPISISEVLSTAEVQAMPGNIPQGNMAGHGIGVGGYAGFKRFFKEHGCIITIMSVLPVTAYQDTIPRMFQRETKFDVFWSQFAHLGEQEVKNKEAFWHPTLATAPALDELFGYQARYAEYRYIPSSVHGLFKTQLDFWHLGRKFASAPALNVEFMDADPGDMERIFAAPVEGNNMYVQIYHKIDALRPIPRFGTPRL